MHKRKNASYISKKRLRILIIIFTGLALVACKSTPTEVGPLSTDVKVAASGVEKVKKPKDRDPPFAEMTIPNDGATNVSINTNIVILVQDIKSGVNLSSVVMTVDGVVVYDGTAPGNYPYTTVTGDPSKYTLTYDHPTPFAPLLLVNVTVYAEDLARNVMALARYSFMTGNPSGNPYGCQDDDDCDDMPNLVELELGTDPNIKTLFIRPKKEIVFLVQYEYWAEFIQLFQDIRPGFADIPALTKAEIEISVIGDPGHPYEPMRDFNYDPAQDSNHPPCDILEVVYSEEKTYCYFGHLNFGHTNFSYIGSTWYWDTKGYVPNDQTSAHYLEYHYFTPLIYPFAIDNYFFEGAYDSIKTGEAPKVPGTGDPCPFNPYKQCYFFDYSSPMNLNAGDPVYGRPDDTVEFNEIIFDGEKKITFVGNMGQGYNRDAVLGRTIAHEMGHALLAAAVNDHCPDTQCIMSGSSVDWEMHEFGPGNCVHMPGGAKDIRAKGVVHNSIH